MNLPAAIDAILEHTLEVDPRDYNAIRLRRRIWLRSIEILQEIWDSWDWGFRYKVDEALVLPSGENEVAAPTDFHSLAYEGAMWIPSQRRSVEERPSSWLMEYRRRNPTVTGFPEYFAAFGGDDDGIPILRFDKLASEEITLQLDYERRPPVLTDRPDDMSAVINTNASTFEIGTYGWKLTYQTVEGQSWHSEALETTFTGDGTQTATLTLPVPPTWSRVTSKSLFGTLLAGSTYVIHTLDIDPSTTTITVTAPVAGGGDAILIPGYSGLERMPEGLFGVLLEGLKVATGYDEGDSRSGGEAEGRFRKRLGRFQRESPGYERKTRIGSLGLPSYGMH